MAERLLPAGPPVYEERPYGGVIDLMIQAKYSIRPTFDPTTNHADRTASSALTRLLPRREELKQLVEELRRELLGAPAKVAIAVAVVVLLLAEFYVLHFQLAQTGMDEPLPTAIAFTVTLCTSLAAYFAARFARGWKKWALHGAVAAVVAGTILLRFRETSGTEEGASSDDLGSALIITGATVVPYLLSEYLIGMIADDAERRKLLQTLEAELEAIEAEIATHTAYINGRYAEVAAWDDQTAREAARLALRSQTEQGVAGPFAHDDDGDRP